MKLTQSEN